eukprot:jgi/Tetstr1/450215/TSEL_037253.t1
MSTAPPTDALLRDTRAALATLGDGGMTHTCKRAQTFKVDWQPFMPTLASAYAGRLARAVPGLEVLELGFDKVASHFITESDKELEWAPFEVKLLLALLARMPRLRNLTLNSVWLDDGDMAALATLSSLQELSTSLATMANDRRDTLTGAGLAELTRVGLQPVRTQLRRLELHGRAGPPMLDVMAVGLP